MLFGVSKCSILSIPSLNQHLQSIFYTLDADQGARPLGTRQTQFPALKEVLIQSTSKPGNTKNTAKTVSSSLLYLVMKRFNCVCVCVCVCVCIIRDHNCSGNAIHVFLNQKIQSRSFRYYLFQQQDQLTFIAIWTAPLKGSVTILPLSVNQCIY